MTDSMRALATPGLRLVPQVGAHAAALFEVLRDPALHLYLDGSAPPASVAALRERLLRLESRVSPDGRQDWLNWVLCPGDDDGRLVGYVQATVERTRAEAWVAFVLAREAWGRGLAARATRAMLDELTTRYGARRALATVDARNARSLVLLQQRLGFTQADAAEARAHDVRPGDVLLGRELP